MCRTGRGREVLWGANCDHNWDGCSNSGSVGCSDNHSWSFRENHTWQRFSSDQNYSWNSHDWSLNIPDQFFQQSCLVVAATRRLIRYCDKRSDRTSNDSSWICQPWLMICAGWLVRNNQLDMPSTSSQLIISTMGGPNSQLMATEAADGQLISIKSTAPKCKRSYPLSAALSLSLCVSGEVNASSADPDSKK